MCVRGVGWAGPSVCMCREGIKKRGMRLGELLTRDVCRARPFMRQEGHLRGPRPFVGPSPTPTKAFYVQRPVCAGVCVGVGVVGYVPASEEHFSGGEGSSSLHPVGLARSPTLLLPCGPTIASLHSFTAFIRVWVVGASRECLSVCQTVERKEHSRSVQEQEACPCPLNEWARPSPIYMNLSVCVCVFPCFALFVVRRTVHSPFLSLSHLFSLFASRDRGALWV